MRGQEEEAKGEGKGIALTEIAERRAMWKQVSEFLAGAVTVVGAAFALFKGVFEESAPPGSEVNLLVQWTMLACLLILLVVWLLLPRRPPRSQQLLLGGFAFLAIVASVGSFLHYLSLESEYVYEYRDGRRYVRGELTEAGRVRARGRAIAKAVEDFGGPLIVKNQILWSEESEKAVARRLQTWYLLAVTLSFSTLVVLVLAGMTRLRKARAVRSDENKQSQ
jgi:hypothetical protein